MSKIEDFENAPVGATATHKATGNRAMKMDDSEQGWIIRVEDYLTNEEMMYWGFTLDTPTPTTAREALDLAWELAHEVKGGQIIPKGAHYLEHYSSGLEEYTAGCDIKITPSLAPLVRTVEPLPDPKPDWLDAPAVLATCGCRGIELWHPLNEKAGMWVSVSGEQVLWSSLRDVTPLYPKEGQEA